MSREPGHESDRLISMIRRWAAVVLVCVAVLWTNAVAAQAVGGSVIGPAQMEGIRTTRDGRGLVLVFVGGRTYSASDPCSVRYTATVRETRKDVNVLVTGDGPPDSPEATICTLEGYFRTVTIRLHAPLGDRQLSGSATPEHGVFDGKLLARPTWLPTGWQTTGESGAGPEGSWTQTWYPEVPPPTDRHCTATETGLSLSQGPLKSVRPFVQKDLAVANQQPAGTYRIHRNDATYYLDPGRGATLLWTEGTEAFSLGTLSACGGDTLTPLDTMLRFARALDTTLPAR
jgi:hypothetical protein